MPIHRQNSCLALYLIGALAKVCNRAASAPGRTALALDSCLKGLMTAFTTNVNDVEARFKLLGTVQELVGMLPEENKRRKKTIAQLEQWRESDLNETLKTKINDILK